MIVYNKGEQYLHLPSWKRWYSTKTKKFYSTKSQAKMMERRAKDEL